MAALKLSFLGPPRIELDGVPVAIQRRRGLALLAYLAVAGARQPRATLAALFWPETDHQRARAALRRDLSELNLAMQDQWLDLDRENCGLRPGYWLDVTEFQRNLALNDAGAESLIAAVNLYRGDFLAGFTLADCAEFDEWQLFQAEGLRQALASALERLVGILGNQGNYEQAILYARRWLALDPWHEPANNQLMRMYAQAGQKGAALRQYELLRQTLEDELGIPPSEETAALYQEIRSGQLRPVAPIAPPTPNPRRSNLPTQTTTFIGRAAELAEIKQYLLDQPVCRLLNLVGPGGIGKTRLALAAAAQAGDAFPDGVYFVALAPVGEVAYVVPAIAEALRFTFFGNIDPKEQLLNYLGSKQLLLVVDNFEHLLEEGGLLSEILQRAPDVTVLATSRERLNLQEEWVYDVHGLAFPAADGGAAPASGEYSALELFTQRARQQVAKFAPSGAEMADIVRICQFVAGMPLALELAAPWIRTLSCREIAEEIRHSLDFLTTTARNVPERHRSIRVVFEQTWSRLAEEERLVMQRLSVFRGGCTRAAAEQVTGATLPVLSSLLDKALLRRTSTGRYELHELIRQFAEAQLQTDRHASETARQRHQDFFVRFLAARTAGVKGYRQTETLAEIEADIDNVRLAWRGATDTRDSGAVARSAECLFVYYLYRNGYDEGILEFGRAMAALGRSSAALGDDGWRTEPVVPDQEAELVGFLLASLGYFVAHRRDLQRGQKLLEPALALLRRATPGAPRTEAFALLWLGWAHFFQGQATEGARLAKECLAIFTAAADHWGEGWALLLLGNCTLVESPAEAAGVYEVGLSLCRSSGDQIVLSYLSLNMGYATKDLGRYQQSQQHVDVAVAISEQLHNILGLGYALLSRGQLEISLGKYRQAVQTLQEAYTHFNKVGTVHASRAQQYLGLAHHLQQDYDLAAQLYGQALDGFNAANNRLEAMRCHSSLGHLAYDQGRLQQAEQCQRETLAFLQAAEPNSWLAAVALRHLGQVMIALGEARHAEAGNYLRQALALAAEHQLAPFALATCVDVAQLQTQVGEAARAIELLVLVEQHAASTFETRQKAHKRLIELGEQARPNAAQAAQDQDNTPDLWAIVYTLLASDTAGTPL